MRSNSTLITGGVIVAGVVIAAMIAHEAPALLAWITRSRSASKIAEYNRLHSVRKLQIGAGLVDYSGWLNTDISPGRDEVYLDATKPFPMPDGSMNYIFGEHVIEHLSYDDGLFMLRECYRVLAPGGKIRMATPNLRKYIQLFQEPKSPEVQAYIHDKLEAHGWARTLEPELTILNLEMRSFGHQFIYDPATLSDRMTQAGFRMVAEFPMGESDDPELQGIEARHTNSWKKTNDYEAMVLQGVRPGP